MKFLVKLLLKAGITLGVMFVGYKFILTGGMDGIQIPGMASITDSASKGIGKIENAVIDQDVTVYQWVDKNGVTQYGGSKPTGQGAYTTKEIRGNTNLLNAYKSPQKEETTAQRGRVASVGNIYSAGGIKNALDSAKNATQQTNDSAAAQQKMLNDILGKK